MIAIALALIQHLADVAPRADTQDVKVRNVTIHLVVPTFNAQTSEWAWDPYLVIRPSTISGKQTGYPSEPGYTPGDGLFAGQDLKAKTIIFYLGVWWRKGNSIWAPRKGIDDRHVVSSFPTSLYAMEGNKQSAIWGKLGLEDKQEGVQRASLLIGGKANESKFKSTRNAVMSWFEMRVKIEGKTVKLDFPFIYLYEDVKAGDEIISYYGKNYDSDNRREEPNARQKPSQAIQKAVKRFIVQHADQPWVQQGYLTCLVDSRHPHMGSALVNMKVVTSK